MSDDCDDDYYERYVARLHKKLKDITDICIYLTIALVFFIPICLTNASLSSTESNCVKIQLDCVSKHNNALIKLLNEKRKVTSKKKIESTSNEQ